MNLSNLKPSRYFFAFFSITYLTTSPSYGIAIPFTSDGSLGSFNPSENVVFDTDTGDFTIGSTNFSGGVIENMGGNLIDNSTIETMVFNFTDFDVPEQVTVTGTGSRSLTLLATENMIINGIINVSGQDGSMNMDGGSGGGGGGGVVSLYTPSDQIVVGSTGKIIALGGNNGDSSNLTNASLTQNGYAQGGIGGPGGGAGGLGGITVAGGSGGTGGSSSFNLSGCGGGGGGGAKFGTGGTGGCAATGGLIGGEDGKDGTATAGGRGGRGGLEFISDGGSGGAGGSFPGGNGIDGAKGGLFAGGGGGGGGGDGLRTRVVDRQGNLVDIRETPPGVPGKGAQGGAGGTIGITVEGTSISISVPGGTPGTGGGAGGVNLGVENSSIIIQGTIDSGYVYAATDNFQNEGQITGEILVDDEGIDSPDNIVTAGGGGAGGTGGDAELIERTIVVPEPTTILGSLLLGSGLIWRKSKNKG